MKKLAVTTALCASIAGTTAFAETATASRIKPEQLRNDMFLSSQSLPPTAQASSAAGSSSAGLLIPLLLVVILAAAASSGGGGGHYLVHHPY